MSCIHYFPLHSDCRQEMLVNGVESALDALLLDAVTAALAPKFY